jgi:hypothetical protein
MDKKQQLELMDKIQRELKDLEQSQTAVLKKVAQIAAHNIMGVDIRIEIARYPGENGRCRSECERDFRSI